MRFSPPLPPGWFAITAAGAKTGCLVSLFTSWASWVCGTLAGAWSGNGLLVDYPAVEAALGFMLPALFMSFLLASFQRQQSLCVTAALAGALGGILLFSIPAAILAGIVCGCLTALLQAMLKGMPDEQ